MDFARKQLEKYGWTAGKGLGKNENGIAEALKPKLKRSVAGIGHDAASEFTEHWWTTLYDKAAGNIQVKEKDGKTKKIKTKDEQFKITNNMWRLNKKSTDSEHDDGFSTYFVKKSILSNGGVTVLNQDSDDSETDKKEVTQLTDEELFRVCEGRTAHKGARHGLKALGKLARIERQEQILLNQDQYNGYSHTKNIKHIKEFEVMNLDSEEDTKLKKKTKKRKRCKSNESVIENTDSAEVLVSKQKKQKRKLVRDASNEIEEDSGRKLKKKSKDYDFEMTMHSSAPTKTKRSKKSQKKCLKTEEAVMEQDISHSDSDLQRAVKKKKRKHDDL